jgi:hypothetical protein
MLTLSQRSEYDKTMLEEGPSQKYVARMYAVLADEVQKKGKASSQLRRAKV